jgi:hypothetical protein
MTFIDNSTEYDQDLPDVTLVRDAVQGQAAIKRKQRTYLPHPSTIDSLTAEQSARYTAYLGRAEFDSSCGQTKSELMGAFTRADHEIDLPAQVKYLEADSDGDWLSLADSINVTAANALEVKYHILLAEFEDGGVDPTKQISKAEKAKLKQRAKIVHYPRESLTAHSFGVVNNRMQLTHAVLTSESQVLNSEFKHVKTKTQLLLKLDEEGFYCQQEIVDKDGNGAVAGDWIYPKAMQKKLNFIPIEIVQDERRYAGSLPRATGYLGAIAMKDVARYQVNADLKEKLAVLQDTINGTGWDENKFEVFKLINGRDYVATGMGATNLFPEGVKYDVMKMQADGDAHFKYIAENEKQTRALGGRYDTEPDTTNTATEAAIKSAKENAILTMIAVNIESAYRRLVAYCCQFEGVVVDSSQIAINVSRQFSSTKMDAAEVEMILKVRDAELMSSLTAIKLIKAGGLGDEDLTAEEELNLISEEAPPPLVADNNNPVAVGDGQ